MAALVEIADPADPRLADYRDLRDVELRKHLEAEHGLFLAEGEKVVRRAVEAGFAPRSFLMAPRWLDGLADVLGDDRRALLRRVARRWPSRSPASTCTAARWPRCERRRCPSVDDGARRRPVGPGARGHRRPHQRRRDLPLAAPRSASTPCCSRRGAPTRSTAARSRSPWARCSRCRGPGCRDWYDALPTLSARGLHHGRADPGRRRRRRRGRRRRPRQGRPGARLARATASRARWEQSADRRAIIPMAAGIDSLNVAAATAVACYVTARRG